MTLWVKNFSTTVVRSGWNFYNPLSMKPKKERRIRQVKKIDRRKAEIDRDIHRAIRKITEKEFRK